MLRNVVILATLLLAGVSAAHAQTRGTCVACHINGDAPLPAAHRGEAWTTSAHATMACQTCHGGDPSSMQPVSTHRGVKPAENPFSTIHPANLSRTCAMCHSATAGAFANTVHQVLLETGDYRPPTCETCHGVTLSHVPTASEAEAACESCHRPGTVRGGYGARIRSQVELLNTLRVRAQAIRNTLEYLDDETREAVTPPLNALQASLAASVSALHSVDLRALEGHTAAAKAQIDLLDARLTAAFRR